jgi:ribose/xylose/arabinose/galactoside ABC-type transport system permease subunit
MTKAKASLQRHNRLFLLVAVLVIATVISRGVFIRPTNLILVMASAAAFGLVSFGQALVVIGGGFDLAVGSLVAMSISGIVFFALTLAFSAARLELSPLRWSLGSSAASRCREQRFLRSSSRSACCQSRTRWPGSLLRVSRSRSRVQ